MRNNQIWFHAFEASAKLSHLMAMFYYEYRNLEIDVSARAHTVLRDYVRNL